MNRKSSSRNARNALCLAALAGLVLATPGAALAEHDHREDRYRAHPTRRVPVHWHGDSCDRSARAAARFHGRQQVVYTCRPCSHRFESQRAFQRHLRSHHHVAVWALPFVVVHHALGWIFYG